MERILKYSTAKLASKVCDGSFACGGRRRIGVGKNRFGGSLTPYFSTATSRGLVEVAENLANTYILVLILECVGKREDVKWDVERTEYCKREREDIN
jgi:hypothetical protein